MKLNFGTITDAATKKTVDLVVKTILPNKLKDIFIGGSMVLAGVVYLTCTAFKYGCESYEKAEYDTLSEVGAINDTVRD